MDAGLHDADQERGTDRRLRILARLEQDGRGQPLDEVARAVVDRRLRFDGAEGAET